jgi:hypothetical protein
MTPPSLHRTPAAAGGMEKPARSETSVAGNTRTSPVWTSALGRKGAVITQQGDALGERHAASVMTDVRNDNRAPRVPNARANTNVHGPLMKMVFRSGDIRRHEVFKKKKKKKGR